MAGSMKLEGCLCGVPLADCTGTFAAGGGGCVGSCCGVGCGFGIDGPLEGLVVGGAGLAGIASAPTTCMSAITPPCTKYESAYELSCGKKTVSRQDVPTPMHALRQYFLTIL